MYEEHTATGQPKAGTWHTSLTQVTPLSRTLAALLFIALPFVGFWLGVGYGTATKFSTLNTQTVSGVPPVDHVVTHEHAHDDGVHVDNVLIPADHQDTLAPSSDSTMIKSDRSDTLVPGRWERLDYPFNEHGKYTVENGVLYYRRYSTLAPIPGADPYTFEYFVENEDPKREWRYARDKDHVFRQERVIERADPLTFWPAQPIWDGYALDKSHVYIDGRVLEGADPSTFAYVGVEDWYKDVNHVYWRERILEGADPDTFGILGAGYSRDKAAVYFNASEIVEADPSSFELLGGGYMHPNPTVNIGSYAKDDAHVFINGDILQDADPATFQYVGTYYSRDAEHVYYGDVFLEGADPATLEIMGSNDYDEIYARDRKHVYNHDVVLDGADPATFEILGNCAIVIQVEAPGHNYVKDASRVWCGSVVLEGADPNTFDVLGDYTVVDSGEGFAVWRAVHARDAKHLYCGARLVEGGDPDNPSQEDWEKCGDNS